MLIFFIVCISWAVGAIAFWMWDSFIGFQIDFDESKNEPPVGLAIWFWPIALPILLASAFNTWLDNAKAQRLAEREQKRKLRIKHEQEVKEYLGQLDQEVIIEDRTYTVGEL